MKRRNFLGLLVLSTSSLCAIDFRETKAEAWEARNLSDAAIKLYGKEKFVTLQKSKKVEIEADKFIVPNARQIPIKFKSELVAKSVALFQTANEQSLVAVFTMNKEMIINHEINIRMDMKGTVFVVLEGMDNRLYYTRQFIDVNEIRCVAGG